MLQNAETEIITMCQARNFWKEIQAVNAGNRVPSTNSIHQLNPFLNEDGVLRVGGRLVKSHLSHELKHPVLVLKYFIILQSIIRSTIMKRLHTQEEG